MQRKRPITRTRFVSLAIGAALLVPVMTAPAAAATSLLPYQVVAVPSQADAVAVGDVTGDRRADIVFATGYANDAANDFHLFVLPQRADGTLGAAVRYATAGGYAARPGSVDLGDVTGDGLIDVVVGLDRLGIQVFPGLADGSLGSPSFLATNDSTRVAIGHFDGDAHADVAGIGWGSNTVTILAGTSTGLDPVATLGARHGGYDDLEVGDVTGDGRDDLIVMSGQLYANPNLSVLAQLAGGGFGPATEYRIGTNILTQGIGLGDVTGDGRTDVVASYGGNRPSSYVAVFAQTAAGALAPPVSYPSYDIPEPVEVADLDGDARPEVVTVHGGWQRVGVYGGLSDGTLAPEALSTVPYASHYNVQGVAIGDINGDGRPDIVEADYNYGLVLLLNAAPPPPKVPGAPTLTSATAADHSVTLAWAAPASNGGASISSYTATASPGGGTCSSPELSCTISGLTNGSAYSLTVHATNSVGSGPESNARSATPAAVPSAPRNVAAKASGSGITITWTGPISDGGSAITAYLVYRGTSSASGTAVATLTPSATSFVDTTAPRKAKSYYWVTAVNAIGESARSNVVSATGR
jgi:fibronectin type III domain protein/VCBS repeat protein